jgi:hypothetical protein
MGASTTQHDANLRMALFPSKDACLDLPGIGRITCSINTPETAKFLAKVCP